MRPFVELSFMPSALASGTTTVFNYEANITPRDYRQWSTLIERLVSHCVERYGRREVSEWFFEVWNEPNLTSFWDGTQRDYFKLYRHTAEAIKKIDAAFRVGGPATAKSEWIEDFVSFCDRNEVPADFISTHYYPNDGFEKVKGTEEQLFRSQRGIMRQVAEDTRRHAGPSGLLHRVERLVRFAKSVARRALRGCFCRLNDHGISVWSKATVSGHSPTFLKRITFRPCRFTAALGC